MNMNEWSTSNFSCWHLLTILLASLAMLVRFVMFFSNIPQGIARNRDPTIECPCNFPLTGSCSKMVLEIYLDVFVGNLPQNCNFYRSSFNTIFLIQGSSSKIHFPIHAQLTKWGSPPSKLNGLKLSDSRCFPQLPGPSPAPRQKPAHCTYKNPKKWAETPGHTGLDEVRSNMCWSKPGGIQ